MTPHDPHGRSRRVPWRRRVIVAAIVLFVVVAAWLASNIVVLTRYNAGWLARADGVCLGVTSGGHPFAGRGAACDV